MCYIDNRNCRTTKHLRTLGFRQLIEDGTHIEGGHIDQAYFRSNNHQDAIAEIYSPYYTAKDHDAICISVEGTEKSQGSYIKMGELDNVLQKTLKIKYIPTFAPPPPLWYKHNCLK